MKWLLTYPEDRPAVGFYTGWVEQGGVQWEIIRPGMPVPEDPGPCDALLLTGGGDIAPASYGDRVVHPKTYDVDPRRDEQEAALCRAFLQRGRPVFGICRGIQVVNVLFGGRLIQDVPEYLGADPEADQHRRKGSYDSRHSVRFDVATDLGRTLAGVAEVNSAHHQAVHPEAVGDGLRVAARSRAGVIEALESQGHGAPVSTVQWHPERLSADDPASAGLRTYWIALAERASHE